MLNNTCFYDSDTIYTMVNDVKWKKTWAVELKPILGTVELKPILRNTAKNAICFKQSMGHIHLDESWWCPLSWTMIYAGFPKSWGVPQAPWMVYFMGDPKMTWMMTGGTLILGNLHIICNIPPDHQQTLGFWGAAYVKMARSLMIAKHHADWW